jgi:tetratricopeptide (TPR) repeat protein
LSTGWSYRAAISLLDSTFEGLTGEDTELLTAGECYTELAAIHQQKNQPDEAIALLKKGLSIYKQLPQQLNATAGMIPVL